MSKKGGSLADRLRGEREEQQRQRKLSRKTREKQREAARAKERYERAQKRVRSAPYDEKKKLEREAQKAYVEAKVAEAAALTESLEEQYEDLDLLLEETLTKDDYVDLESFRVSAEHPPFDRDELKTPLEPPTEIPDPPQPQLVPPRGPSKLPGSKKRYENRLAIAQYEHLRQMQQWQQEMEQVARARTQQQSDYAAAEASRKAQLQEALERYERECKERENEASRQNAELDQLINGLAYGTEEAVKEYVSIVLANSIYPEGFPVKHKATFVPATAELVLDVSIPGPEKVPTQKMYRYVRTKDKIESSQLSQKAIRERYADIVQAVALRSLHEVFEADRRGLIKAISLEVGSRAKSPALGRLVYVPFIAVATSREKFEQIDVSGALPSAALEYLGAAVSKAPHLLTPVDVSGFRTNP